MRRGLREEVVWGVDCGVLWGFFEREPRAGGEGEERIEIESERRILGVDVLVFLGGRRSGLSCLEGGCYPLLLLLVQSYAMRCVWYAALRRDEEKELGITTTKRK